MFILRHEAKEAYSQIYMKVLIPVYRLTSSHFHLIYHYKLIVLSHILDIALLVPRSQIYILYKSKMPVKKFKMQCQLGM